MKTPEETNEKQQSDHEKYLEKHRDFKIPDKDLSREGWLDIVKPAYLRRGHTDYLLHQEADTTLRRSRAKMQNYWLSRRSFGMPDNYERIQWGHDGGGATEASTDSDNTNATRQCRQW